MRFVRYSFLFLVLLMMLAAATLSACGIARREILSGERTPRPVDVLSQWAVSAEASTEFGFPDWSADRATGAPDVNACADDSLAWASARGESLEWLSLRYAKPVYATGVRVYQTLGRGAISGVLLVDQEGAAHMVWEGTDRRGPCPGVLEVTMAPTLYKVVGVRVELNESRTEFWNQIDAVELLGIP
jgi:hypothetical protein